MMPTYPPVYFRVNGETESQGGEGGSPESYWDVHIVKAADFDVENNATFQDDPEVSFPVTAGDVWLIEAFIIYSGNDTTGDWKHQFTYPANSNGVRTRLMASDSTTNAAVDSSAIKLNTGAMSSGGGVVASHGKCVMTYTMFLVVTENGTVQLQSANNSAGTGRISRTHAGTLVRAKRLASA